MKKILNIKTILSILLLIASIIKLNIYYIVSSILLVILNILTYTKMKKYQDKKVINYFNKIKKLYFMIIIILILISSIFILINNNFITFALTSLSLLVISIPNNSKLNNLNSLIKYQEYNYIIRSSVIVFALLTSIMDLPSVINPSILLFFEILIVISGLTFKILDKVELKCKFENEMVTTIQSIMISLNIMLLFSYILGASENIPLANSVYLTLFVLSNFYLVAVKIRRKNFFKNLFYLAVNGVYLLPISLVYLILIYIPIGNKVFNSSKLTVYSLLLCLVLAYITICWYDLIKLIGRGKNEKSSKKIQKD